VANQKGLGRGLDALFGASLPDIEPSDVLMEVAVSEIEANPDQPRRTFDEDELEELAASIAENGLLQPIVVRRVDGHYQIVAGERRWQAAQLAGLEQMQVIVREVSNEQVLRLALIENLQRSDLTPIEEAMGIRALMEQEGLTQEQAAKVLSKSRSALTNALRLLDLPSVVQDMISSGMLSAGHGRAILAVKDTEARVALAEKVVRDRLSVRQTEILASKFSVNDEKGEEEQSPRPASPAAFATVAESLGRSLNTKVAVKTVRGHHRIEIEFGSEDELNTLVERILNTQRHDGEEVIG